MAPPKKIQPTMSREELEESYVNSYIEMMDLLEVKGKQDLFIFNKHVLNVTEGGGKVPLGDFHKELCHFVQNRRDKKKLILVPRGHLKSTLITVGYPLFRICQDQNVRILILNATWQMAVDFLSEIKGHLQKNETLTTLYGELAADPVEWSQDRITLQRTDRGKKGPTVWAAGIDTNLVGSHPDVIIMDDVVNRDNAMSQEMMEKVILRYKDALDLLEPGGQLIVVGTMWNDSDLYNWILNPDNNIISSYDLFKRPAFESDFSLQEVFSENGEVLMRNRLWADKFSYKELADRYREQGPYHFCTPYESPVIMGDMSVKKIGEIVVGEEVVGWDDDPKGSKLVKSRVKAIHQYEAEIVEMTMESGRLVRCTPEHKWFTARGQNDPTHKRYKPAKVGSRLMWILNPYIPELNEEQKQLASWLGGFFDADGSCGSGYNSIGLHQSRFANPTVFKKIPEVLNKLNFKYSYWEKVYNPENPRSRTGFKGMYWLTGGKQVKMDFLNLCKPFKAERILQTIFGKTNFIQEKDKVVEIKPIGPRKVYALETETGNYIVWGYGSSNSAQYLLNPVPPDDADFKKEWFRYAESQDWGGKWTSCCMTIDPAISLEKEADFTAIVVTWIDPQGSIFVRHTERVKVKPYELINLIFLLNEQFHPKTIGLEMVAFQKTLQYSLKEEMGKRNRYLPIVEVKTQDRTKAERIKALQPLYANGKIYHNKGDKNLVHLEQELLRFPRSSHDDLADALSMQLDLLVPPRPKVSRYHHQYLYG